MTTFTPLADIPVTSRASVKKSSGVLKLNLKLLGTSQDMEIVDDRAAAQIEEILAQSAIACAPSLPVTDVSEGMLNGDPFAQFGASLRRLLVLAQFDEQGFFRHLGQLPPLLIGHHAHDLLERVSQQIIRVLDSSRSPQRTAIQGSTQGP